MPRTQVMRKSKQQMCVCVLMYIHAQCVHICVRAYSECVKCVRIYMNIKHAYGVICMHGVCVRVRVLHIYMRM